MNNPLNRNCVCTTTISAKTSGVRFHQDETYSRYEMTTYEGKKQTRIFFDETRSVTISTKKADRLFPLINI